MTEQMKNRIDTECTKYSNPALFETGTDWFRNNVWHDASEEPIHSKPFAINSKNGVVTASYTLFDDKGLTWKQIKVLDNVSKWCYTEDILPDKE